MRILRLILYSLLFNFLWNKSEPGNYCEVIPDPIPNSEVKPFAPMVLYLKIWKSRTLPGYNTVLKVGSRTKN